MHPANEPPDHAIFASYGNDSVALIQWAHERGLQHMRGYCESALDAAIDTAIKEAGNG